MAKKMIEQEKKWFVKEPAKLEEILEAAGLLANNELIAKAIYADINRLYSVKSYADTFIRKSVIVSHYAKRRRYKVKLLDTVLANKWLFYTQEIEMGTDVLIQPVFDMEKMTERKINSLIKAITNNDYEKVKKLVPNDVAKFDKYSRCLFKEEEVNTDSSDSIHNSYPSAPARDGSELTPQNEQEKAEIDCQQTANGTATDCQPVDNALSTHFTAPIISTRVDAKENREKRIGEKENKRFNSDWLVDKGSIGGEIEASQPASRDETTGRTDESFLTAESSWEDYLEKLTPESKELQSLMSFAGEDDGNFLMCNLDKFKLVLNNLLELRGKKKDERLKNNYYKNEYLFTLLSKPTERAKLVREVNKCLTFKVVSEFRFHKEGYKHDLFNKNGDRMSCGRIIPKDAPPKPSPDHWWDFEVGMWCR